MQRVPHLLLACLILACSKAPAPTVAQEACTGDTPLVEGIPGSPGHLVESSANPNGMSELALLMRMMVSDLEAARELIERGGQPPPLAARYRKIRCAWPTRANMRTPEFDGLAASYLAAVAEFDEHPQERRERYAAVVKGCRSCHEVTCEGPLGVIDGLALRSASNKP